MRFAVGDIVKYADEWSTPAERKYVFVVLECNEARNEKENDMYMVKGLNTKSELGYYERVQDYMIEAYGEGKK